MEITVGSQRMTAKTRWFLVRHGETEWNSEGRAQGQSDVPLSDEGRGQAARLFAVFVPVRFDAAYSSDLSRAVDTADCILSGRGMALVKFEALREKGFGEWEGKTFKQMQESCPTMFRRIFGDESADFVPEGGKSDRELYALVKTCVDGLRRRHAAGGDILVVAHGVTLRAVITSLLGLPPESMWRFRFENCAVSVLSVSNSGATLDMHNYVVHMRGVFETEG